MKEFTINAAESGQKCIKYCEKLLPEAGTGFLYKMLRKKNITLNGKKADGNERLNQGDVLRFFFSDDTFRVFSGKTPQNSVINIPMLDPKQIIYEDEHILLYNKPSGVLSQKAKPEDISVNEMFLMYLQSQNSAGRTMAEDKQTNQNTVSKPSVCNRLDRNTSGLILCGKTYLGLRTMNAMLADRSVGKYYHCLVAGRITEPIRLRGYLKKDEKTNTVTIKDQAFEGASYIETEIIPLKATEHISLLEVHLITGKTHQIRSHLAHLGHPILGDSKYGNPKINDRYRKKYHLKHQLLHAYRLEFPVLEGELGYLSRKQFIAPKPVFFSTIEKEELRGNMEF
nr:RluA family pseudouridine synthase [Lachnospiraceae bacterium]